MLLNHLDLVIKKRNHVLLVMSQQPLSTQQNLLVAMVMVEQFLQMILIKQNAIDLLESMVKVEINMIILQLA